MLSALIESIRVVAANAAEDLDATLDALAGQATRLFGADEALVHLAAPGTDELVSRGLGRLATPDAIGPAAGDRFKGSTATRQALASGRPIVIEECATDERAATIRRVYPTVASSMIVPLLVAQERVGVLVLLWRASRRIGREEVEIAEALAQHAAVAVRTARLVQENRELAEHERRLRAELEATLDATPDAIYIVDAGGRIVRTNRRARELFVERQGALPSTVEEFRRLLGLGPDQAPLAVEHALTGTPATREDGRIEADGRHHRYHIAAAPIRDTRGNVVAAVTISRDVTDMHAAIEERARLDGAVKTARMVAHELNGQLSPILAYADLLASRLSGQEGAMAHEMADAAERAARTIGRLQHIVRFEETATPVGPMLDLRQAAAI
jgi:PAS domain S-box-containing protein